MAYTAAYVYCMEVVGPKYRSSLGIWIQALFAIGYGMLSPVSFLLPGWQNLQILIGLVVVPQVILIFIFVDESARYLFVRGEVEKSVGVLVKIGQRDSKAYEVI